MRMIFAATAIVLSISATVAQAGSSYQGQSLQGQYLNGATAAPVTLGSGNLISIELPR
jgi:hypothetical protein